MKTHILALVTTLMLTISVKAQYVTIPDAAFVTWLQQSDFSACINGNQLDTTCSAALTSFSIQNIQDNNITSLDGIEYLTAVRELTIGCPALATFPVLPANLESLSPGVGTYTTMPPLPNGLRYLYLGGDEVYKLSLPLPASLRYLGIVSGNMSVVPTLPDSLTSLYIQFNQITSLPSLPSSLTRLEVINCLLSSLPPLPNALRELLVSGNYITSISAWPDSLRVADIAANFSITTVPPLPSQLTSFIASSTSLAALPTLPPSIRILQANYTNITHVPALPQKMETLGVINSQVTSITNFPDSITYQCGISNNTNLHCIPPIGYIKEMYMYGTGISCLPNYGDVQTSTPLLNTFPLCGLYNTHGCEILSNVAGTDYFDGNNNCVNNNETSIGNVKHSLWKDGIMISQTYSGLEGEYSFAVNDTGIYEVHVDTTGLQVSLSCPVSGIYIDTLTISQSIFHDNDFAFKCKSGFDVSAWSVATPTVFRPANNTIANISAGDISNFYNAHCAAGVSGTVTVSINGPATYVSPASGALTPSNVTNNVITWNVADFGTIDALHSFNVVVHTDTFAQIGQQVCFTVNVTPTAGDNNPTNNTLTHCFNVVNSYDPNDKQVSPTGDIDTAQEWLTYTVRFQNTGNAEAQHIYIMDTLDTDVDAGSFQLLAYSHQPNVQINENIVRFNFPNINLPDSNTNEPGSHGYVQYKVKLKEDLPIGTNIENTAFIYFDFNPAVITNTITNTVAEIQDTTEVGIRSVGKELSLSIYPNPANSSLTITTNHNGNALTVYNAQGSIVLKQAMNGSAETLSIAELAGGVYYVEVSSMQGTARKKFIKL